MNILEGLKKSLQEEVEHKILMLILLYFFKLPSLSVWAKSQSVMLLIKHKKGCS